ACQTAALRYPGSMPCANALLPCVNWHMHRLQTEIHRGEPFERAPRGFLLVRRQPHLPHSREILKSSALREWRARPGKMHRNLSCSTPPGRFEENDAGSDRYIETFHLAAHRDAHQEIAALARQAPHAFPLEIGRASCRERGQT